ncbi:MAG: hypothetical protein A3C35_05080 [Omnitrophica bacterium RIFCSPHIGHO2_02_FULL_46_11]|nr:MAG: hypothetical protein A3C35_05080 [Omnitrophica bacterium RIFCSPHIGHO2_02_FULL_46_11]OGW87805.1 MAG: hypothetical protein A3A81_01775 [Omnitrophica bacterium RIFCSPLOWO2_01_FULL_45_10b]
MIAGSGHPVEERQVPHGKSCRKSGRANPLPATIHTGDEGFGREYQPTKAFFSFGTTWIAPLPVGLLRNVEKRMKKTVYLIEYAVIRSVSFFLNLLPLSLALYLARPIGFLLFLLLGRSRRMALDNIRQAYSSEKSESEIREIARGAFIHLTEFGVEWLSMPRMIRHPEHYLVTVHRGDQVQAALQKGKGAIVLVCHTGNWEIMALMGGLLVARPVGASVYALARPLKNPYLYEYALRLRGGMGLKSIEKGGGVRETLNCLKENGIVCILMDQRVSEGSIETNFFGRPALTTSLPIIAALRLGTPVFFNFLHRTNDCHYTMSVEGPLSIESTGNVRTDIQVNTQRFVDRIETEIRKKPIHWLWMHNRWRPQHGSKD